MASPLTKPSITGWGTMRMNLPHLRIPMTIWMIPHQHHGGEEIFHAMLGDEAYHDHGECTGGAGNHARSPAGNACDQPDQESGVKTDQRIDAGDKCKGNRFRHQRKGHGQSSQQLDLDAVRRQFGRYRRNGLGTCGQGALQLVVVLRSRAGCLERKAPRIRWIRACFYRFYCAAARVPFGKRLCAAHIEAEASCKRPCNLAAIS